MKFSIIPLKKIIFKTNLSDSEVIESLNSKICVLKNFSFKNYEKNIGKEFYGKIGSTNNFEIYQIIKGRNSFIPIVKGNIVAKNDETKIITVMRFHYLVIAFMVFFIGFICIGNLFEYYKSGNFRN
jgi:hypothetical protein